MAILLTTPEQRLSQNSEVILNGKDIKLWISQLPTTNIAATVTALDKAICGLNELLLNDRDRFALLEIYHEAYDAILQTYDEMRLKQLKVTPMERMSLAKQIMWLYVKLGHGYKIIVKSAHENGINPKKETYVLTSIFRSMELICHSLMFSKRCHTNPPVKALLEINQLLAYAEKFDAHTLPIRAVKGYAKTPTAASFHALIQLMDLIDPDSLDSLQIQTLFFSLQPFCLSCRYTRDFVKDANYNYSFHLDEDRCVKPCAAPDQSESTRYLVLDDCVKELQNWLDSNQGDDNFMIETELQLFPQLLSQLEQNRHSAITVQQSESQPIQVGQSVRIATGLVSIQSLLISELAHLPVSAGEKLQQWTVNKVTAHGCELIRKTGLDDEPISLGDCVAVVCRTQSEAKLTVKTVALIHKAELLADQHISIHIEYLSEHATPIGYHLDRNKPGNDDLYSGILMPRGSAMCHQPYLIINKKHYRENRNYSIKLPDKVIHIHPKKLIMNTVHYAIFLYNTVNELSDASELIRHTA
ncbi:MAG: hypothetical protein OEZ68_01370 [Gammaproteobacteria bacterium]|nr:hypothetical protein [Gammaproteobacteria bacterium]MDH5799429.1 hypothetical protein [Gammaproteobacteria bacterium]